MREYNRRNFEKKKQRDALYYKKNREKILENVSKYTKENSEKYSSYQKAYRIKNKKYLNEYSRLYRIKHLQEERYRARETRRKRYPIDVNFRLKRLLRSRLYRYTKKGDRIGSAVKNLGCSVDELKIHLEKQFLDGMSWSNHGEWHIDHIKPLAKFDLKDKKQLLIACHYTNLQPLWAKENIIKSNK
jgi:hypothetical protein